MRIMAVFLSILMFSGMAVAKSHKLHFSGRVAEKVDVKTAKNGELQITKNSPHLKVVVHKRAPASLITVQAP
ncbi:hypothetical protein ACES2I_01015 [Bdellovibrio bacteriovorus]|uniref:hypothetical protein n=1 Tax=Bdellovibrio bacteriovorus TaxID=959 RepID=UPI0035A5EBC7